MLERIHSPADLSCLSDKELKSLSEEIRSELIHTVSQNGGHLASNLGVVELTLALHRVFDAPEDKIIFDVGHQSYVHKLITGRYDRFHTLRKYDGIAGFPRREESQYDCFETGHASTSISAALGLARARDALGENHHVIALTGDGAMTGGMCYEALNDAGHSRTRLIVVLNDNEMSIAKNVGALSNYLTSLRISAGWQSAKKKVRRLTDIPMIGKALYKIIHASKKLLKSLLVHGNNPGFFEALGFQYFGPINGHDIASMEKTFEKAKECQGPCVIHVLTKKGYGYNQAEERPEAFHGTPPFLIETGDRINTPGTPSAGHIMADTLAEMAATDKRIVAITAAMKLGTGLDHFEEKCPGRLMDVGIAEEHAVTLAAGLAAGGMRPYVAIYSTFFQRCYDQMIHDVAMQRLPVVFLLDRSGIGGEDGKTHHGLFDFAELLPVPGMTVLAPSSTSQLCDMIRWSVTQSGPCAIRYSKKGLFDNPRIMDGIADDFHAWTEVRKGKDVVLLAVGSMLKNTLESAELLEQHHISASVVRVSILKPYDKSFLDHADPRVPLITLEEHMITGGFGEYMSGICSETGFPPPAACIGVSDCFIPHGTHEQLMTDAGLDPEKIADRVLHTLERKNG